MKHWILGGSLVLLATVLLFRNRTSTRQTIPPPTIPPPTTTAVPVTPGE